MTREEIKSRILEEVNKILTDDPYGFGRTHEQVAEEIMKLWDQGFTYEVKDERT